MASRIGNFDLIEQLGTSPHGPTHLALDTLRDRMIALKQFRSLEDVVRSGRHHEFVTHTSGLADIEAPTYAQHFSASPSTDMPPWIAREYVNGVTLQGVFGHSRRLERTFAAAIAHEVASAMAGIHDTDQVHGNLKLTNVFVQQAGGVKLTDAAVAAPLLTLVPGPVQYGTGRFGSPAFLAPEQLTGGYPTAATDMYSFGVLAYLLLCGEYPFEDLELGAIRRKKLTSDFAHPTEHQPDLSAPLVTLITDALAREPERRIGTMGEAADRLRAWLALQGKDPQHALLEGVQTISYVFMMTGMSPRSEPTIAEPSPKGSVTQRTVAMLPDAVNVDLRDLPTSPKNTRWIQEQRGAPPLAARPATGRKSTSPRHRARPPVATPESPDLPPPALAPQTGETERPLKPSREPTPPPVMVPLTQRAPTRPEMPQAADDASTPSSGGLAEVPNARTAPTVFYPPEAVVVEAPTPERIDEPATSKGYLLAAVSILLLAALYGAFFQEPETTDEQPRSEAPPAATAVDTQLLLEQAREAGALGPELALAKARAAAAALPNLGEATILLARALVRSGAYDEAYDVLEKANAQLPESPEPLRLKAEMLLALGNNEAAQTTARRGLETHGTDAPLFVLLARAQLAEREIKAAVESLRNATFMAPENSAAWRLLGEAEHKQSHYEKAAQAWIRAIELRPRDTAAYIGLGNALVAGGRGGLAAETLAAGLSVAPKSMQLRYAVGRVMLLDGRPGDALKHLELYTAQAGSDWRGWFSLGLARLRSNNPAGAAQAFQMALQRQPAKAEIHYDLGLALARNGETARALSAFSEALTHQAELWQAHCERARLYQSLGRVEAAKTDYRRVLELKPGVAVATAVMNAPAQSGLAFLQAGLPCSSLNDLDIPVSRPL